MTLFRRGHRSVALTEAGERFHADVTLGLSHIRKSAEDLRARAREAHVTLAASTAFASMWMLPRLYKLREDLPDVDLRIQTADRDLDLENEPIQLGVRGGRPEHWPDYHAARIAPELIYPVASPLYVERHGMPESVAHLTQHRLIHLEEPFRKAADWATWFTSAGINAATANRGLSINDYVLVIQAAMEGQGVALGWHHLIQRMVASGLLVRLCRPRAGDRGGVLCHLAEIPHALRARGGGAGLADRRRQAGSGRDQGLPARVDPASGATRADDMVPSRRRGSS